MSHRKHCSHNCQHLHVKFCAVCGNVYCEDCDKEWFSYTLTYTTYPYSTMWWTNTSGDSLKCNVSCSHG